MIFLVLEFSVMTVMSVNIVVVLNGWADFDENSGWCGSWIEYSDEYDDWVGYSDKCDECNGISSILWLFSGSSDNSGSVSCDCFSFSADIDRLVVEWINVMFVWLW